MPFNSTPFKTNPTSINVTLTTKHIKKTKKTKRETKEEGNACLVCERRVQLKNNNRSFLVEIVYSEMLTKLRRQTEVEAQTT